MYSFSTRIDFNIATHRHVKQLRLQWQTLQDPVHTRAFTETPIRPYCKYAYTIWFPRQFRCSICTPRRIYYSDFFFDCCALKKSACLFEITSERNISGTVENKTIFPFNRIRTHSSRGVRYDATEFTGFRGCSTETSSGPRGGTNAIRIRLAGGPRSPPCIKYHSADRDCVPGNPIHSIPIKNILIRNEINIIDVTERAANDLYQR